MGNENRSAKRSKFRDPNQGSSWMPLILILGLGLGVPALLAVAILGAVFTMAYFATRAGKELINEVELEQKRHHEAMLAAQAERDMAAKKQAENLFKKQPKFPLADDPWQRLKDKEPEVAAILPPLARIPGTNMCDLIGLIDPSKDAIGNRRWEIINNELHCKDQGGVPRVQIPYQPPQEYDFIVAFSQPGLRNGISLIMPNPNGGSFFWHIGSGNGSLYGFAAKPANIDGQSPGLIKTNAMYTTTVQVRRNSVRALLDGKQLMNFQTDFRNLTSDGWRGIPDPRLLAVACDDPTVFHFVRIVEINGAGKRMR